uniref:N-acetylneuraminate lyase n=1 Tax=Felis catus TaxID=9685 RepID=A0ABI7WEB3_FELCA
MASRKKKLQGLVAATITPMTEHGEINFSVIGQYVDYLVEEQGVKNIFVNGTTGEGLSLSVSERRQVAEEWMTKGRNKLDQVVIHVGALSLKESQELARHAAEIGADGIAVIAPFFLKPWDKDVLINFLKEVAAAAPALPFYYYHIPALTGVKTTTECPGDGSNGSGGQFCIQRFINFVLKLGFGVSQTKAIMTLVSGIPMGPPRPPLQRASREFIDEAKARLESLDFLSSTYLKDRNLESCS